MSFTPTFLLTHAVCFFLVKGEIDTQQRRLQILQPLYYISPWIL